MIEVTYKTYVEILKKEYVNIKIVKSMDDFRLFAISLNLHITDLKTRSL